MTDVANPGWLTRPPIVYLAALVAGGLLQLAWPLQLLPPAFSVVMGVPLVIAAIALFVSSVVKFRAAGTPVPGHQATTAIVRAGPYRFSRNPIYLAFSLLHLGIAIWVNSLWLLATLAGALLLMHYVVIPTEERYLERRFGAEYLDYKASVRRWL